MKTYSRKNSSYLKKAFVASNFNEMCRLCLSEVDSLLIPIVQDCKLSYQEWIHYSVDVLVEEGDGLPPNICEECLGTVEQMYLFKKKCKASDSKLREHLELVELNEECKLNNTGFKDISDDNNLFQTVDPKSSQVKCDVDDNDDEDDDGDGRNQVDGGGTADSKCETAGESQKMAADDGDEVMTESKSQQPTQQQQQQQYAGKTVKRYILRGEKREDGQEEDLTVCEVVPLDVKSDESAEETTGNGHPEPGTPGRIQEIYKLWGNEEEGSGGVGIPEPDADGGDADVKAEENIVVFNVLWDDSSGRPDPDPGPKTRSDPAVKTQRVYLNKNQIEIVETVPETRWFKCFACSEQFAAYATLREHLAKVHGDVSDAPYCETCGKNFTCANSLKRHMAVHTGFKPYECKVCERRFSQGSILKRHELTHETLKPFNCHICQKSYTQKMNLLSHLKNHGFRTATESFTCKFCGKTFVHQSGLSRHVKLHKGIRFVCVHCKKSFGDASALARHVKALHQHQQQQQQQQKTQQ